MKILFATSEAVPYFKSGGLADVSRTLPDFLVRAGHEVRIILPRYGSVPTGIDATGQPEPTLVPWLAGGVPTRYVTHTQGVGALAVLVDQPGFFQAGSPYGGATRDPLELGRRFAFFGRAVVHYAKQWQPDVVHLNDWTTGLVPVWGTIDELDAATVFAIHNLAYQGNFAPALLAQVGIPLTFYRPENGIEFHNSVSFLKAGLALSDRLVTVSPTYAREIQTPAYGAGLDGLLRFRRRVLHGILNGIDTDLWNPALDSSLATTYNAKTLSRKTQNRDALLAETGLDGDGPIVAMVTRLAVQKGIDIVLRALPHLLQIGARIVVLGDGDAAYERDLASAARAAPRRIASLLRFDDALARRIYAGADFFLMPSVYEPCGLGQMIAQRYGTPPIARHTGGLADTITHEKTGFLFDQPSPAALVSACRHAFTSWRARGWNALQRRCMATDWSWDRSARLYEELYRIAVGHLSR
jgi:starch synthase